MSKVVIYSAANASAVANLQHSVIEGVGIEVRDSRMFPELQRRAEDGGIRLWGMPPGDRCSHAE